MHPSFYRKVGDGSQCRWQQRSLQTSPALSESTARLASDLRSNSPVVHVKVASVRVRFHVLRRLCGTAFARPPRRTLHSGNRQSSGPRSSKATPDRLSLSGNRVGHIPSARGVGGVGAVIEGCVGSSPGRLWPSSVCSVGLWVGARLGVQFDTGQAFWPMVDLRHTSVGTATTTGTPATTATARDTPTTPRRRRVVHRPRKPRRVAARRCLAVS